MTLDTKASPYEVLYANTRYLTREEWLAARKLGLGSSDAAPALGLSPWRSQYELWAEKVGILKERPDNDRFRVGRLAEPLVMELWCEDSEYALDEIERHVMCRSIEHPFMLANPDGLTHDAVIEIKTAHSMDEKRWEAGVPDQYVIQGLHLMAVTGRRKCIFPVMFGWSLPRAFVLNLDGFEDEELAESMASMIVVEAEFWRRVQDKDAPDPDGSESSMMALREQFYATEQGKRIELGEAGQLLIIERELATNKQKIGKQGVDSVKAHLMKMLGDAEIGTVYGETVVTWKANKNGVRSMRFMGEES